MIFCFLAIFLSEVPSLQMHIFLLCTLLLIGNYLIMHPYEKRSINIQEIFNEISLYIIIIFYLEFTYFDKNDDNNIRVGLLCLGVILFNFMINVLILITKLVSSIIVAIKRAIVPRYRKGSKKQTKSKFQNRVYAEENRMNSFFYRNNDFEINSPDYRLGLEARNVSP